MSTFKVSLLPCRTTLGCWWNASRTTQLSMVCLLTTLLQRLLKCCLDTDDFLQRITACRALLVSVIGVFLHIISYGFSPAGEGRKVPLAVSHGSTSTPTCAHSHMCACTHAHTHTHIPASPGLLLLSSVNLASASLCQPLLIPSKWQQKSGTLPLCHVTTHCRSLAMRLYFPRRGKLEGS